MEIKAAESAAPQRSAYGGPIKTLERARLPNCSPRGPNCPARGPNCQCQAAAAGPTARLAGPTARLAGPTARLAGWHELLGPRPAQLV